MEYISVANCKGKASLTKDQKNSTESFFKIRIHNLRSNLGSLVEIEVQNREPVFHGDFKAQLPGKDCREIFQEALFGLNFLLTILMKIVTTFTFTEINE